MAEDPPPEQEEPKKRTRSPRCPVCSEALGRKELVLCSGCHAPHHARCWDFNKGCALYGCDCRTSVAADGHAGPLELEVQGRPDLFGMLGVVVLFAAATALLKAYWLIPKSFAKPLLKVLKPLFWGGIVTSLLGPAATRQRYRVDPLEGRVERKLLVGPWAIQHDVAWRDFDQVLGLEVRIADLPGRVPWEGHKGVEVWLKDAGGERHLVDRARWEDREVLLGQASALAEMLDTTLGLPKGLSPALGLPTRLGEALAKLPGAGGAGPALPAEPSE